MAMDGRQHSQPSEAKSKNTPGSNGGLSSDAGRAPPIVADMDITLPVAVLALGVATSTTAATAPTPYVPITIEAQVDLPLTTRCRSVHPTPIDYVPSTRMLTARCDAGEWTCKVDDFTFDLRTRTATYTCDTQPTRTGDLELTLYPAAQKVVRNGNAVLDVVVRNAGGVTLENVTVAIPGAPSCSKTWATLPPGVTQGKLCEQAAVTQSGTLVATAIASQLGASLTAQATSRVLVNEGRLAASLERAQFDVASGSSAALVIRVANTGDTTLMDVLVADTRFNDCAAAMPGAVAPGAGYRLACQAGPNFNSHDGRIDVSATDAGVPLVTSTTYRVDVIPSDRLFSNGFDHD